MSGPRTRQFENRLFLGGMASFGATYLLLIVAMVAADLQFTTADDVMQMLRDPYVRFSIGLSLLSCTASAILATWFAVPTGYLLARWGPSTNQGEVPRGPHLLKRFVETLFDIPVVLPPLVVGISLLVLFQTPPGRWLDQGFGKWMAAMGLPEIQGITYEVPAVILAQFVVATAFAIRIMRATFESMDPEPEQVARVLGATPGQAFSYIALPQAWNGVVNALTIAWARSLGEFGPILVFAGMTRMKTEVLSTTVYLNFSIGNLRGAVTASVLMLVLATGTLFGLQLLRNRSVT
ncbi:MAG: ABC transporter permease subunit [Planctomycetota bacterium]